MAQRDTAYLYDGWNMVAELNAGSGNATLRTYVWGTDLSGSRGGAGGVGGLLWVNNAQSGLPTGIQFAAYDGNGNVAGLFAASDGSNTARYEYGPFGEPLRMTGTLAKANPVRWSTKVTDDEGGLVYYGYRYYNPTTGRWISRDPIRERGGLHLFSMMANNAVNNIDILGFCKLGDKINIKCESKVLNYLTDPKNEEDKDEAWKLKEYLDKWDFGSSFFKKASSVGFRLSTEALAKLINEMIDEKGSAIKALEDAYGEAFDPDAIAKLARDAFDKARGAFGGFYLFTRITYDECKSCPKLFGLYRSNGYSPDATPWKRSSQKTDTSILDDNRYQTKEGGYAAADEVCEKEIEAFRNSGN